MILPAKVPILLMLFLLGAFFGPDDFDAYAQDVPCYRVQTASFLTIEASSEHLLHLEKILANILPFDSTVTLRIEKYTPYYVVRVGCLEDREQMDSLLAMLRLYWPDAKIVDSLNAANQFVLVASRTVNGLLEDEGNGDVVTESPDEFHGVSIEEDAGLSAFAKPVIEVKGDANSSAVSPENAVSSEVQPFVQVKVLEEKSPEKIIRKSDYLIFIFLVILSFLALSITCRIQRQL